MKKYYLGFLAFVLASSVSAQLAKQERIFKMQSFEEAPSKTTTPHEKILPFWANNFSTPSDWTIANGGAGSTPPHTSGDWQITTNVNSGPVNALNPAGFSTAANGFAIINSDSAGSGQTQNATIVTSAVIDCSSHPYVSMTFQETTRHYDEHYYVVVSNDNGATWTTFAVNTTMPSNSNSLNPATVQINISSVAAGQANVKIGFKYTGNYDWFWAVDDVQLFEPANYDLAINGLYWGSLGNYGIRMPYYQIPLAQITEINFGGSLENRGALSQNDCVFNVAIPSAAYASYSVDDTLSPNQIDTVDASATFTPGATAASYAVTSSVTSGATEAYPADNLYNSLTFNTNNFVYARDAQVGTSSFFNSGNGYEVGNVFDIFANASLKGVDIQIHANTVADASIYATLYSIDPSDGSFVYVQQSDIHTITASEIGHMVTIIFDNAIPLTAGTSYLLIAGSFGSSGVNDDFVVGTSGISEPQTTYYLDGNENNGTWYYNTSTPMVRMNFDPNLSVKENNVAANMSVYPNPASDKATVSFHIDNSSQAKVLVTDLSGKLVSSVELVSVVGSNKVEINTSAMAAGIYTVELHTNSSVVTKKLVVRK